MGRSPPKLPAPIEILKPKTCCGLLLLAGAGYLGLRWITRDKPTAVVVAVPDAHPADPRNLLLRQPMTHHS